MELNEKKGERMIRTAVLMVIITLSAKILGMLRDVLLAASYGTSPEAVAYDTASRLPIIIFDFIIGGVVTASFIPVFNEVLVKKGKKDAFDFANGYVNVILIITAALTALGIIFAGPLVSLLAPDIDVDTASLAVSLSRVMFPMMIFTGLAFSFVGILQSSGSFLLPALISLVSNLIMVAYFIFFNDKFGIWGLSVAMLCGWGAQAIIQLPSVIKKGYRYSPKFDIRSEYIRKSMKMALPILVSSWVQPFCNLINTRFASSIENGSAIPAMGYANRLYLIIVGVFTFVATNLLFPYFSKAKASGNREDEEKLTRVSIRSLELIILPITLGIFVLAEPIVALIYQRNEFGVEDVRMTAEALRFFSLGMPFYALNEVCTKKFFAEQKTLPPMITALISIAFNFAFVTVLSDKMGIAGIAISSAIAVAINTLLNFALRYRGGERMLALRDMLDLIIMLVSALVMSASVYALGFMLPSTFIGLALNMLIGALIYFVICLALGERMTRDMLLKILRIKRGA